MTKETFATRVTERLNWYYWTKTQTPELQQRVKLCRERAATIQTQSECFAVQREFAELCRLLERQPNCSADDTLRRNYELFVNGDRSWPPPYHSDQYSWGKE